MEKSEYSLQVYDPPHFTSVLKMSKLEFDKYSDQINSLSKLSRDENLFRMVELNYQDIQNLIDKTLKQIAEKKADQSIFDYLFLDINRLILNFLSSIRTYLDHTETRLKKQYGKDSSEFKIFKEKTSYAYDNNFSYRFLYKLRNFAQHCGLPASAFNITSSDEGNFLKLSLVRNDLIKNYDGWGKLKTELANQDEQFDILELLLVKIDLLKVINTDINRLTYEYYKEAGFELLHLLLKTKGMKGGPCLVASKGNPKGLNLVISHFPFEIIGKVTGAEIKIINASTNNYVN